MLRNALSLKRNWMNNTELSFNCVSMQEPCPTFEYMLWFESLLFFGFEEHTTLQKDEDIGLLPAIVEKVILSKLSGSDSCLAALGISRRNPLRGMQYRYPVQNTSRVLVFVVVLVEQVWDPLSSSQTARLVVFIHRLVEGYPTVLQGDNKYTQVEHHFCSLAKNVSCDRMAPIF